MTIAEKKRFADCVVKKSFFLKKVSQWSTLIFVEWFLLTTNIAFMLHVQVAELKLTKINGICCVKMRTRRKQLFQYCQWCYKKMIGTYHPIYDYEEQYQVAYRGKRFRSRYSIAWRNYKRKQRYRINKIPRIHFVLIFYKLLPREINLYILSKANII